ncbi:MAG: hypothetical protein K8T91_18700 [Planctomycetes bacterium]|nr:hypothetical protein [Planctomycetota bacterium]
MATSQSDACSSNEPTPDIRHEIVRAHGRPRESKAIGSFRPISKPSPIDRKQLRAAVAAITQTPEEELSEAAVDKVLVKVKKSAIVTGNLLGNHLDGVVAHRKSIGCTSEQEVADYIDLERRVLVSLYSESAKPSPSPTVLLKLALRYSLDARKEIEGDIQRFDLRRRPTGWEIIEYSSPALKIAGVDMPGRLITNVFKVTILDFLHCETPPFFQVLTFLERLLEGVPNKKESLECLTLKPSSPVPVIRVELDKDVVWIDDEPAGVNKEVAYFVDAVAAANGKWISGGKIKKSEKHGLMVGARPDRVAKRVPSQVRKFIEAKGGKGFRLQGAQYPDQMILP